jgi:hypothetical protein
VGPKDDLDIWAKIQDLTYRESNPSHRARSTATIPTDLFRLSTVSKQKTNVSYKLCRYVYDYLQTKFHLLSYSGSLVHAIKPNAKYRIIQKDVHIFKKIILQVLLNIWRRAIYRLKGELSKLFSHFTNTRCESHV